MEGDVGGAGWVYGLPRRIREGLDGALRTIYFGVYYYKNKNTLQL